MIRTTLLSHTSRHLAQCHRQSLQGVGATATASTSWENRAFSTPIRRAPRQQNKNDNLGANDSQTNNKGNQGDGGKVGGGTSDDTPELPIHKQPFVTTRLEPGEWDPQHRVDPLYRPKFQSSAKVISAEDFANRPMVMFEDEFVSYSDAMITLGWLDQATCRQMYHVYVDMIVLSQQKHERTSHEYVCKLIAQKFRITPWRAAAVIQLQHNEEQMRRSNPELMCDEEAKYAQDTIQKNIRDAYASEGTQPPKYFVEDPVGAHGRGGPDDTSSNWKRTDDVFDLEQKLDQANIRDAERARMIIDNHVYVEDVDEDKTTVTVDKNCHKLLSAKNKLEEESAKAQAADRAKIPYPKTNAKGEKRPRFKFVAQVVDTRVQRQKGRNSHNYTNNNTENTLVELDGQLRIASLEESKHVAWKRVRQGNEFIYQGVKRAWLERTVHGKTDGWGRAPMTKAAPQKQLVQQEETPKMDASAAPPQDDSKDVVEEKENDETVVDDTVEDSIDEDAEGDKDK
jgi:hypothetical protein